MNPLKPEAAPHLQEDWDQLEVTAQFLEDLSTQVATGEEKQSCLDTAHDFHLAVRRSKRDG